jgi:hypothetical protein
MSSVSLKCTKDQIDELDSQLANGVRIKFIIHKTNKFDIVYVSSKDTIHYYAFCDVRLVRNGQVVKTCDLVVGDEVELRMQNGQRKAVLIYHGYLKTRGLTS